MPITPLDEFTTEEIATLQEVVGSGNGIVDLLHRNGPLITMDFTRSPWRNEALLYGKTTIIGQEMTACGVSTTESHEPEEDVFKVRQSVETRTKKWYRKPAEGPGDWTLYQTLEWVITTTVSPAGVSMLRDSDGPIPAPSCVPHVEGEKPDHWDEGYSEDGFVFGSANDPTTYRDEDILTGSAAASAGRGSEVTLSEGSWGVVKRYGRAWASGNTPVFASFSGDGAPRNLSTSVRRVKMELELVGWRIASTLKWTETRTKPGEPNDVTERSVDLDASTGWAYTLDTGYPTYGWTCHISNLRVVSV